MKHKSWTSSLLLALFALMGVGLVQVYSSSFVFAIETYSDGLFFFKRQLFFSALGLGVVAFVTWLPMDLIRRYGWWLWAVASVFVLLTWLPGLGVKVGGAHRWIQLPFGFRFEPAELLKVGFILLMATLIARSQELNPKRTVTWSIFIITPLLFVLNQPDFGTFALIVAVGMALLFAFGMSWKVIIASFLVAIPTFYFLVMNVSYRRARVMAFLDPWSESHQKGFQAIQSMLSFHAGGFWGTGLGQGQGKLFFLPEAHTDFTLAVLGEEMGFVGLFLILSLFGYVIYRCFQLSLRTEDRFQKAVCLGVGLILGVTVVINAGMSMGLLPTKGMALPFLSYGGSSLVTTCLLFGILLKIENEIMSRDQSRQRISRILKS
ncbi:MAG: putative lipid II flippase FtsW [Bdellovibrionales bacterium]